MPTRLHRWLAADYVPVTFLLTVAMITITVYYGHLLTSLVMGDEVPSYMHALGAIAHILTLALLIFMDVRHNKKRAMTRLSLDLVDASQTEAFSGFVREANLVLGTIDDHVQRQHLFELATDTLTSMAADRQEGWSPPTQNTADWSEDALFAFMTDALLYLSSQGVRTLSYVDRSGRAVTLDTEEPYPM